MVYTITFNPAVDVVVTVEDLVLGGINRTASQEIYYGGKGVNVSQILRTLGRESVVMGFLAGNIGHAMEEALASDGLAGDFTHLPEGETRVNTKLRSPGQDGSLVETALNAGGPHVDADSLECMREKLRTIPAGSILIVSGGAPAGVASDEYARILEDQTGRDVLVVVDAEGDLLVNTLRYGPFLVKPNDEELAGIVGCAADDYEALLQGARELQEKGAMNVLVSRGGKGAFLIDADGNLHESDALSGKLVNSVGAGDSTVAGFVHGYLEGIERGLDMHGVYDRAFKMALVCGAATAFSEGLAPRSTIDALLVQVS